MTVIPDCLATVHFLLLTLDAGLHSTAEGVDCRTNQSILHDRLSSVLDIVNSVNSRAYLSEVKVHQALLMVLVLLKELEFQHGLLHMKMCYFVLNYFSVWCLAHLRFVSGFTSQSADFSQVWHTF